MYRRPRPNSTRSGNPTGRGMLPLTLEIPLGSPPFGAAHLPGREWRAAPVELAQGKQAEIPRRKTPREFFYRLNKRLYGFVDAVLRVVGTHSRVIRPTLVV